MSVDWTKPIQTRDGRKAELLCKDLLGDFSHAVKVKCKEGNMIGCYKPNGNRFQHESDYDIINVPPQKVKREGWIVFFNHNKLVWDTLFESESAAIAFSGGMKVVTICRIEWEESV